MSDPDLEFRQVLSATSVSHSIDREAAVNLARVVLRYSVDDDDAKTLLRMLIGPLKVWHTCPVCGRHYETAEAYQKVCGNRNTWHMHALEDPARR